MYWRPRRPPERDDQDPGHRRGRPRDRAGHLRGHQRQRHAALLGRGLREVAEALHPRARAPPGGGPAARRALGGELLRVAGRHRGRQAARGSWQARACAARPRSPTRAPPTSVSRRSSTSERFAVLRRDGAPVQRPLWASTGVKDPKYPETMYVDGLVGPDTVNTMPMPTLLAVAERGEIAGADGRPGSDRAARRARRAPASTWTT